jgi:hypothetical protein
MRLVVLALALASAPAAAAELALNLYGASYHFNRDKAREMGLTEEFNPGLGPRWRKRQWERHDLFADVGFYRDSAGRTARVAGGGLLWRAGESLRLGGAVALLRSDTYNRGQAFVAPVPLVAYDARFGNFNVTFFPKYGTVNETSQLGFWLSIPLLDTGR